MNDERLVRLENLRLVMDRRKLVVADLVRDVGNRTSFWYDLLAGKKSFGEKLARNIEQGLGLPRLWLDTPQSEPPTTSLFRDLDPFEAQFFTLLRLHKDLQPGMLGELQNRIGAKTAAPHPRRRSPPATRPALGKNEQQKRRPVPKKKGPR